IHIDDAAEVFQRHWAAVLAYQTFGAADAGAIDQDPCGAMGLGSRVQRILYAFRIGYVAGKRKAADLFGKRLSSLLVQVQYCHPGARGGQLAHRFRAQPRSASCDERVLSLNVHDSPLCRYRYRLWPCARQREVVLQVSTGLTWRTPCRHGARTRRGGCRAAQVLVSPAEWIRA